MILAADELVLISRPSHRVDFDNNYDCRKTRGTVSSEWHQCLLWKTEEGWGTTTFHKYKL